MKPILLLSLAGLLLLAGSSSFAQAPVQNDKRIVALEPQLEKLLKEWKIAGFAVAVVDKGGVIYAKGFGYRDVEHKLPATPNTLFEIGSCTKAFTASLIGMLAADKLLDIDKPVHNYLPQLEFFNNGLTDNVTLRDMMSHRTGLPRHDYSWYFFPTSSRDTLLQRIRYMEPSAGLRDRWQYNNFMFLLQGITAEKLTGKRWEDLVRTKIFGPLGMSRTNVSIADLSKDGDGSLGYDLAADSSIKKVPYFSVDAMGPAGSINSSVMEMGKWVRTWINGGKFDGKDVIPGSFL
ncbi:MAG TPA: serine hydrolase domain-containing protein, partial [Chitinophagaceae bacterium]